MDFVALRHKLHKIPEIAFGEHKTKALLMQSLNSMSLDSQWKTREFTNSPGILVEYKTGEGSFRLFRADIDALPSTENTACSYQSEHPGMMHACGHDVHMAILMGLIHHISLNKPKCNLLFLFQPAEEGKGGAQSILDEGLIQNYSIDSAIALHVAGEMPVGTISTKAGIFFGIPQEFDVRFYGKGAHVAYPEKGINALNAGLEFMNRIQTSISELSKQERVLFNIGRMVSGVIRNIIPDTCILEGTHRSLSPFARDTMNSQIKEIAGAVAAETNTRAEVELLCSYDPVVNDAALVSDLKDVANRMSCPFIEAETAMAGEDFGFFTTLYPGLLFWLGSGCSQPLHSDKFLPNDDCIEVGINVLSRLAAINKKSEQH